jgi:hypothetical protein
MRGSSSLIGCTWVPLGLEVVSGRRQLYLAVSGGAAILERRRAGAWDRSGGGAGARTGPSSPSVGACVEARVNTVTKFSLQEEE